MSGGSTWQSPPELYFLKAVILTESIPESRVQFREWNGLCVCPMSITLHSIVGVVNSVIKNLPMFLPQPEQTADNKWDHIIFLD